jgi:hypothetical protein
MRKQSILLVFLVLVFFSSFIGQKGYNIKEASDENWKFTGGKLLFKGGEQELKYSIAYIGKNEIEPINLTFDFSISPKNRDNKKEINTAEHLHSMINGFMDKKINNNYTKKDSFKDKLLDPKREYDFEKLYLKVSYEADGKKHEEVIELPMEKI